MATSGSKNFTYTRNDIINAALRKIAEYDPGEAPSGDEVSDAAFALNLLIQSLVVKGADIWLRTELTLFLQKGQKKYSIGPTGDHCTESYVETTLSAAEASGQTVLSITSEAGITAADYIGIAVDDGSIHWSTVSSTGVGTVTIADALDGDAASGSNVYAYTTKAYRPHSILEDTIYRRDASGIDSDVSLIGEEDYTNLTNKSQTGTPTIAFYKATTTSGSLYFWPTGDGTTDKIVFTAMYYPDDFDSASDNADFPVEWGNPLVYGLARDLGEEYSVPDRKMRRIYALANEYINDALDFDVENADVQFGRDVRE